MKESFRVQGEGGEGRAEASETQKDRLRWGESSQMGRPLTKGK